MTQIHGVPDEAITLTVDVSAIWEIKMSAILCHRTQLGETPILATNNEKQHLFLGREYFRRVQTRLERDFFLRTFSSVEENNL